jgi:hypothetical protein
MRRPFRSSLILKEEEEMRKTAQVMALVMALSIFTYAGEMQCPAPVPPPPSASEQSSVETEGGEIPNGEPDSYTQTALTILGSLLTLL